MRVPGRETTRVVLIDALRGICFVVMTVDHLPDGPFQRFSNAANGAVGFFTAALGFVFLSGLVAGLVYGTQRANDGNGPMARHVAQRMSRLYVTQIVLIVAVAVAVASHLRGSERWHLALLSSDAWKGLAMGATLGYEPEYLGILPMYLVFLALTPLVLWQFAKGNLVPVLACSVALWIVSGLAIRLPEHTSGIDFGAFNPLGYQLLFVVGLAFGSGELAVDRLSAVTRGRLLRASIVVAALFFALRLQYAFHGPLDRLVDGPSELYSSVQLGPLRLLDFAAFAFIVFTLSRRVDWAKVGSPWFRWPAFIGRHGLPVYAWSILVAYAAVAFAPLHPGFLVGLIVTILAVASLSVPARLHESYRVRRRRLVAALLATPPAESEGRSPA